MWRKVKVLVPYVRVRVVPPALLALVLNSVLFWRTLIGFVVLAEVQDTPEVQLLCPTGMVQLEAVMVAVGGGATDTTTESDTPLSQKILYVSPEAGTVRVSPVMF